VHKYLGMTINYSTKGVTQIFMVDNVKDIVVAWDKASDRIELDGFKIKYRKSSSRLLHPRTCSRWMRIRQSCQKSRKQPSTM
jgi:hypothetical protein